MPNANSAAGSATAGREISSKRIFDAPRKLVWKAWTHPEHMPDRVYYNHEGIRF